MSASLKHLTAFQRDILYLAADLEMPYGLGIKRALDEYYGEEVNRGRVYQNLGKLVDGGYLDKSPIDKRTNSYSLTSKAVRAMEGRHRWQYSRINRQVQIEDLRASLWH